MTTTVECATGLAPPKGRRPSRGIQLRIEPDPQANVRLRVENIESRIVREFEPVVLDLLEFAAYAYVADTSIARGRHDPFGEQWYRDIRLVVPVREVARWQRVRQSLEELLTFLSGDARIQIEFRPYVGKTHPSQPYIEFPSTDAGYKGANSVVLFSGGIDSLAGALYEITAGRVPLLLSHRSAATRVAAQKGLIRQLQGAHKDGVYALNMWVNRIGEGQADVNQRLRSFLYLSLAFAVAHQLGIRQVLYCENGISSFNFPLAADRIGTRSSRTTSPRVTALFSEITRQLLECDVSLENPFLLSSKADVMERIVDSGHGHLIPYAVTCARTIRATRGSPNCGVCYQCVMRRFAGEQRELQDYDPPRVYAKDIFLDELPEGESRANAVQWVRFNQRVQNLVDEEFEMNFPEVADFYPYLAEPKQDTLGRIFRLYRKNAEEVLAVIESKQKKYFREFMAGALGPHSLLSLIGQRRHLEDPLQPVVLRIAGLAEVGLRRAFSETLPTNEADLQKQLEIILEAASERVQREYPSVRFSIVKTTPDFSDAKGTLFIETKLHKDPKRKAALVDALLADRDKYTAAGAAVLFVVYQTAPYIADPRELIDKIAREEVFVKVIG